MVPLSWAGADRPVRRPLPRPRGGAPSFVQAPCLAPIHLAVFAARTAPEGVQEARPSVALPLWARATLGAGERAVRR